MNTARMDLDDYKGNVRDGVHIANMAGTWMCVVNGFAGMRTYGDVLILNPYLPVGWDEYTFKLDFKGCQLSVTVNKSETQYILTKGSSLEIIHSGEKLLLANGQIVAKPTQRQ